MSANNLDYARMHIDELDVQIQELITRRAKLAEEVARAKHSTKDKPIIYRPEREAEILRAEGSKQAQILDAEGEREAAFREAEARERLAEAEANATRVVSDAIAAGDINAINYFIAQNYTEALKEIGTSDNQKLLMLPVEATSLIGSLAGIADVVKAAGMSNTDKS